jgi:hypothetical protein
MKIQTIAYHLERAAIARADAKAGRMIGRHGPASHLARAARHDDKAAAYLAEGLAKYAARAMTKGARDQRRLRRRRGGTGPGRGHKGASGYVSAGGVLGFIKPPSPD